MLFQFNLAVTEDDYLAFNIFHAFESPHGKKMIRKARICFVTIMACLALLLVMALDGVIFSLIYAAFLGLFTVIYMLLFKKVVTRNTKAQMKRLKKTGKLPFSPEVTLEFHEDKLVEITPSARMEQSYAVLERICVVQNHFILLYTSSSNAHILPLAQVRTQADSEEFVKFLSKKCNTVAYYEKA